MYTVETGLRELRGVGRGPLIASCRTVHDTPLDEGQDHFPYRLISQILYCGGHKATFLALVQLYVSF